MIHCLKGEEGKSRLFTPSVICLSGYLFILSQGILTADVVWCFFSGPAGLCLAPTCMEVSRDEMENLHSRKDLLHWSMEEWGKNWFCQIRCTLGVFWIRASLRTSAFFSGAGWESIQPVPWELGWFSSARLATFLSPLSVGAARGNLGKSNTQSKYWNTVVCLCKWLYDNLIFLLHDMASALCREAKLFF